MPYLPAKVSPLRLEGAADEWPTARKILLPLCHFRLRRTFQPPRIAMRNQIRPRPSMANQQIQLPPVEGPSLDSRTAARYSLHARAVFQWNDQDGFQQVGRGHTRNISQKGAYIVSAELPPQGVSISLNIYLPTLAGDTRLLSLQAEGNVLRCELNCEREPSSGSGFAISAQRVSLTTN
jgi:hypothetical protein